jgi:hypothetical protein
MIKQTRSVAGPAAPRSPRLLRATALRDVRGGGTYQKIEWTWNDGGVTANDDWEART